MRANKGHIFLPMFRMWLKWAFFFFFLLVVEVAISLSLPRACLHAGASPVKSQKLKNTHWIAILNTSNNIYPWRDRIRNSQWRKPSYKPTLPVTPLHRPLKILLPSSQHCSGLRVIGKTFFISVLSQQMMKQLPRLQTSTIKLSLSSSAVALRWYSAGNEPDVFLPDLTIQETKEMVP